MDFFTYICIIIIILCSFVIWIIPLLLSWIFALKYQMKLTIGMIALPYLKLKDVRVTNKGMSLDIDEIGISSSLLNSDVTKKIALIVKDVRINRLVPLSPSSDDGTVERKNFGLHRIKIPNIICLVLQFTVLQIKNISIVWVDSKGWLVHTTSAEIKLEGNSVIGASKEAILSVTTSQTKSRIRRRASENIDYAEFNFSVTANTTIPNLFSDKFHIFIQRPRCILNMNVFQPLRDYKSSPTRKSCNDSDSSLDFRNFIPKNFIFSIENTEVMINFPDGKTVTASFQNCKINARRTQLNLLSFYLAFKMDDLKIISPDTKLFFLKNISLDAKLQKDIVNIYVILNTVNIILIKDKWPDLQMIPNDNSSVKSKHSTNSQWKKWNVECCLELWSISGTINTHSVLMCGHSKVVVQRSVEQWTAELLLESLGWTLIGSTIIERKNHVIGTPLYLAVALIKILYSKNHLKIDAMLDILRVEWNSNLARMLENYRRTKETDIVSNRTKWDILPKSFNFNFDLSNCNIFFYLQNTANIFTRLDSLLLEGNESKIKVHFSGFKMLDMDLHVTEFSCCRSKDMTLECVSFLKSQIEFHFDDGNRSLLEWHLNVFNSMEIHWNHTFHMKILSIFRSFSQNNNLKSNLQQQKYQPQITRKTVKWSTQFGKLIIAISLGGKHSLELEANQAKIGGGNQLQFDFALTKVIIDHVLMGIGTTLTLYQTETNVELQEERDEAEDLELETPRNSAWIFNLDVLEVKFPYIHEFSEVIQSEFVTTVKWLKIVHKKKKVPFTVDSPLPRDLLIKINKCLIELSDDPFEVRLRDNYELLVDEYKESLKRQQMLDKKVTELRQTHLLLPAGKVDELYTNLRKKNAEIYIQRSKQITSSNPQRTRLLAWELQGFTILALADHSFHGTERAVAALQRMDPNSPLPPVECSQFSTLWARVISVYLDGSIVRLRDFPQKFLECRKLHLWGLLIGAEAAPTARSIRHVVVELPEPWCAMTVERSMTQLKFYHDLNLKMDHYSYAFGPCWEPVIAQCNLSLERIFAPSRDPSPPLPFWDKFRLLLHGRLTMVVQYMTVLLHASLDPYNTTEEMQITWKELALDWIDGKIKMNGDLDVYVRTASKYDDCRLLHLPNVKLTIKLTWVCLADPNDHHSVIPCAPDKLPEYSSNQVHDSYRAFRSQNVDMNMYLEAKGKTSDISLLLLYGSTLRWFENLKFILSGVTRPTRRGVLFGTTKPRRKPLSRHYGRVGILLSLHRFQISYWMSFTMQNGCEIIGNRVVCSSEHNLTLTPFNDNLIRRPRAVWSIIYMNCEVTETQVWLKSALQNDDDDEEEYDNLEDCEIRTNTSDMPPSVEKYYCLSVSRVSYGRETPYVDSRDTPTHRLVVHDLKGAWTKNNRDIAFALFDAYVKSQQLRKNLSADALKIGSGTNNRNDKLEDNKIDSLDSSMMSISSDDNIGHHQSPASMLEQLIAEADHKAVVFSDDQSPSGRQTRLQGLQACQQDDVKHKNWLIALVNSQVVLRGCFTKGYVILSAAKAEILQRIHEPESKKTWVGSLECLQYFATVGADDEDIMWLPVEYIQERLCGGSAIGTGPAAVVGSGHAAGGVVSSVVGASGRQIQRIVSRCRCEFFYVSYGSLEPTGPSSDAFTLMHHDLDVCTNSLQYAMLLDIVNSLLLWTEPNRKEAAARLARLRFQLQLRSDRSVRIPVQKLQTQVRGLLGALRQLERDAYLVGQSGAASRLHDQLTELKTELSVRSEELDMLLAIHRGSAPHTTVRAHEIYFKHAQWRLTEADGQLGIADLVLSNFLYTKNSKSDDSVEHLLELGYIHMTNLLPNQIYTEVLSPTEIQRDMPVDHKHVLRIFCRERPPVGGISVKEHFEINVVPITIGLTKKFYSTLLKFCFPERDDPDAMQSKVSKDTSFYVRIDQKDDVEKMKERAEKNKLFIYIKIPEVPVRVSYKGNKEKNIEDVRDFSLVIPTLEYHNVTWTWLDLLLAMKSDTRKVILSQAIKQKLQINRGNRGNSIDNSTPLEEDKARMLLGKLPSLQK